MGARGAVLPLAALLVDAVERALVLALRKERQGLYEWRRTHGNAVAEAEHAALRQSEAAADVNRLEQELLAQGWEVPGESEIGLNIYTGPSLDLH